MTIEDTGLCLVLRGVADIDDVARLGEILTDLHEQLVRAKSREVRVDIRDLAFMNSLCLKEIVSWFSAIEALDAREQYRVRFLTATDKQWQRRSLAALACFQIELEISQEVRKPRVNHF